MKKYHDVDTEITIHNTKFTASNAAMSTEQAILPCALHSEVWFWVGTGNSSKSTFLHLLYNQ